MTTPLPSGRDERVLVLMPTEKDAGRTRALLSGLGLSCVACADPAELCREVEEGAGAVVLTEGYFSGAQGRRLVEALRVQPPWSALPLIVLTRPGDGSPRDDLMAAGNVSLVDQPVRTRTLISAVHAGLRARRQQYDIRDALLERMKQADALRESESRYRTLVEQVRDYAIFRTNTDGVATSWNEGVQRVLGFDEDDFIGADVTCRIFTPEDVAAGVPRRELETAARDGSAGNDRWMMRRDGARFFAMGVTTGLKDEEGRLVGFTKVMRDATDWKNATDRLRQADRQKDEFLATLAHELRNPLAPISNSVHLLRLSQSLDADAAGILELAEGQLAHLIRLVDDLLEVSRITQGKIELRRSAVDLVSALEGAVSTSRPLVETCRHRVILKMPDEPLTVWADPVRVTQIFANLINNAAKYTDAGGEIRIAASRQGSDAVVSIRDTGVGIPADMLPRVFDLFTQVDNTLVRTRGGLGIGLTLVKNFVELHGGRIEARSDGPGCGSEFVVRLPLVSSASLPAAQKAPAVRRELPRRRILVVDDTRAAAYMLSRLLEALGQQVEMTHDAVSALERIESERPDLVFSDIAMPRIDGYELARRLRLAPGSEHLVLVALTGYGQESDRRRALDAGFNYHLVKPVSLKTLQDLLSSLPERNGNVTAVRSPA